MPRLLTSQEKQARWLPRINAFLAAKEESPGLSPKKFTQDKEFSWVGLYKVAREFGIDITNPETCPTISEMAARAPDQVALLDGCLLGDACLLYTHKGKNKFPVLIQASKHEEYLLWLITQLEVLAGRRVIPYGYRDARTNKVYSQSRVKSRSCAFLQDQYQRWYPNGHKTIPADLQFNCETLLHWYLGDGSRATHGGVYFATDGFALDEVEQLGQRITELIGSPCRPHKNDGHHRLYIPARYADAFFGAIGPCPVACFSYKWK